MERISSNGSSPTVQDWQEAAGISPPSNATTFKAKEAPRLAEGVTVEPYRGQHGGLFSLADASRAGEKGVTPGTSERLRKNASDYLQSGGQSPSHGEIRSLLASLAPIPQQHMAWERELSTLKPALASAQDIYAAFMRDPASFFARAGLGLVPPRPDLERGEPFFLQQKGPPATWLPVKPQVERGSGSALADDFTITLHSLEGHPLPGFQAIGIKQEQDKAYVSWRTSADLWKWEGSPGPEQQQFKRDAEGMMHGMVDALAGIQPSRAKPAGK